VNRRAGKRNENLRHTAGGSGVLGDTLGTPGTKRTFVVVVYIGDPEITYNFPHVSRSTGSRPPQSHHTTSPDLAGSENALAGAPSIVEGTPGVPRPPSSERAAWDALRAAAMLLGVVLHALIPYMAVPVPHLLWPVREPQPLGAGVDIAYWWIHGFRVQMFFIIAGIFAATTLRSRGVREFLLRRIQRLGVPLVLGTALVLPVMYLVWAWGWVRMGLATPSNVLHVRFRHGMQQDLYGFAHLWFLYYLLIFSVLLGSFVGIARTLAPVMIRAEGWRFLNAGFLTRGRMLRGIAGGLLGLGAAGPFAIMLYYPRVVTEFHHWFVPHPADLAYSASYYLVGLAVGVLWGRGSNRKVNVVDFAAPLLGAMAVFVIFYARFKEGSVLGDYGFALPMAMYTLLSYAGFSSLFRWLAQRQSRYISYLAALAPPALWLYIVHPPVVGLVQILLLDISIPAWIKVLIAAVIATVAGVLTFPLADRVGQAVWSRGISQRRKIMSQP
jgi:glucan biosynthesis protein C